MKAKINSAVITYGEAKSTKINVTLFAEIAPGVMQSGDSYEFVFDGQALNDAPKQIAAVQAKLDVIGRPVVEVLPV